MFRILDKISHFLRHKIPAFKVIVCEGVELIKKEIREENRYVHPQLCSGNFWKIRLRDMHKNNGGFAFLKGWFQIFSSSLSPGKKTL